MAALKQPSVLPGFGLTFGFTTFFLSAIVLIPLAALVLMAASMTWHDFVKVVFSARAMGSYKLSFGASFLAATINLVFGFVIATVIYFTGLPMLVNPSVIGYLDPKSPEAQAGIREGDKIVGVDGKPVKSWQEDNPEHVFDLATTIENDDGPGQLFRAVHKQGQH